MQKSTQKQVRITTEKKPGIWLALLIALALHAIILLLPVAGQIPIIKDFREPIELQLTAFRQQPPALLQTEIEPVSLAPETEPLPLPEFREEPPVLPPENQTMVQTVVTEPPPSKPGLVVRELHHDLEQMSQPEKEQLTSTILARQFFTEKSEADQLFGTPLHQNTSEWRKEFHYPLRQNMLDMLDQSLPEVPFAYTPGLIYFAYDPGIKGDLQRFFDVITPEFGWRTKYGTEVRCKWVLVIVGCGWK